MLCYMPDDSARARVRDLILQAQTRDRQQAWNVKNDHKIEFQKIQRKLWELKTTRRSLA